MIKCVVFDLDGTIIDDEEFTISSKVIEGKKYGFNIDPEIVKGSLGLSENNSKIYFESIYGKNFPTELLRGKRIEYIVEDMKKNGIKFKKGFFQLFSYLKEHNLKAVICTSTRKQNFEYYRQYSSIFDEFDFIVTGDLVDKGKPNPDIFLFGAQKVHIEPKDCLVIEDSNTGVRGAISAKMDVIMVPDLVAPDKELVSRVKIYNNLTEVIDYLENVNC